MQEAASQAGASVGELGAQVLPATDALAQGADMAASATTSMADAGLEQAQEAVQGTAQQQILTQAATSAAGALVELTAAATAAAAAQSSAAGTEAASSGALLLGASTMHSGGLVGRDGKKSAWPAALFENAPRFHRGSLKNDEIASILQKGEVVLSKDQVSTIGRATEGSGMMGASGAELKRFVDQALGRDRQGFAGIETASFTRTGAARAGRADPQYGIDGFRTEQLLASRRHDPPPAAGNLTQSIARDRAPASGGATITNNFHISTPNADSFRLSQGQIMARAQTAMSQAQSRNR